MLQLRPPPMPHAVFARPSLQLPHQLPDSRLSSSYLGQPVVSSTSSKATDRYFQRDITPPADMNMGIQFGRASGSQHHLVAQRDGRAYGTRPHSQLYPSSNPPVSQQSSGRPYSALPSPTSQRSSKPTESTEKSKNSDGQVAPSLRIPDTIHTPQSGLPQLAAEVC